MFGLLNTDESTVANVLKISGFATGPVLGLYLLAVFVPRATQVSALIGFLLGVIVLSATAYGTAVYWAWYALIGSLVTLAAGWAAQLLRGDSALSSKGEHV
jgi:hypothetical protein